MLLFKLIAFFVLFFESHEFRLKRRRRKVTIVVNQGEGPINPDPSNTLTLDPANQGKGLINPELLKEEVNLYSSFASRIISHTQEMTSKLKENEIYSLFSSNTIAQLPLSNEPTKDLTILDYKMNFSSAQSSFNYFLLVTKQNSFNYFGMRNVINSTKIFFLGLNETNLFLVSPSGNIIGSASLNFNSKKAKIIGADFTYFTEDNSIVLITETNDIYILTVKILIEKDMNSASLFIQSLKNTILNIPSHFSLITIKQQKLHGGRYIVVAYENGDIFVLGKELGLKSAIELKKNLTDLFISNGVIFCVINRKIIALNLLGGNMILLSCDSYYDIGRVVYDNVNSMIFFVNSNSDLIILNVKLSIAKPFENECSPIYQMHLPEFMDLSSLTLSFQKNELFIISSNYLGTMNLNNIKLDSLKLNHYALIRTQNETDGLPQLNKSTYQVIFGNEIGVFYVLSNTFDVFKLRDIKKKIGTHKEAKSGKVECNGNYICGFLFNTDGNNFNFTMIIYFLTIVGIAIYIIVKKKKSEANSKLEEKKIDEAATKKFAEILKEFENMEKSKKKGAKYEEGNKKSFDEEKYAEEEEEELDEEDDSEENQYNREYQEYIQQMKENQRFYDRKMEK